MVLCLRLSRHVSVVEIDNDGRTAAFLHLVPKTRQT